VSGCQQLASLYRCEESQFLGEAEKIVKQFKPMQPGQANEGLAVAVDVWSDRGLSVDLKPLVLKQLKVDANSQNSYQAPGYLVRYFAGMAKKSKRDQQLALLDEIATIYVAPLRSVMISSKRTTTATRFVGNSERAYLCLRAITRATLSAPRADVYRARASRTVRWPQAAAELRISGARGQPPNANEKSGCRDGHAEGIAVVTRPGTFPATRVQQRR